MPWAIDMKEFERITKKDLAVFCLMSILAGMMIGIGGASSLLANSLLPGAWGKLIGGMLFSLGMYVIITYEMRLFTGMAALIPTIGLKNSWRLPLCFIGNALGIGITSLLVAFSPLAGAVIPQAQALIAGKLNADAAWLNSFCSSVLCGMLITASIWAVKYAPARGLNGTVGVILPIVVFAFCGFDHSVANMMYFYYLGEVSWRVTWYIICSIVGNLFGGVLMPLVIMLKTGKRGTL